jgi:hypothetical protein
MQSLPFQKILRKFKNEKSIKSHIFPLVLDNISIDMPLPKLQIFTEPTVAVYDSIYETKNKNDLITNECFYSDGILGNVYNIQDCDKYWLLSFCISAHFQDKFTDDIKCFVMGYNSSTFINGLNHYCNNTRLELHWLGMGFNTKHNNNNNNNNILRGFSQDNLCDRDNLTHIKHTIENKMGNINMIYNNISPEPNYRILLSSAVLVLTSMPSGIFISKIPEVNNWNDNFINYLLLFALLFNNTEICRFPVSTSNKSNILSFQYFLICHDRKKILHKITAYRKILTYMKKCEKENSDILNFSDEITAIDWKTNVMNIKQKYIQADLQDNPQLKLCEILDKIKNIL